MFQRLLTAVVLSLATGPITAQQPTFTSRSEIVRVDVLVSDRNGPVRGLTAADFEITDAGVPQQVNLVSFDQVPITVALALDVSASITPAELENLRDGGIAILESLKGDDQVSLFTFGDLVTLNEPLTSDARRIRAALQQLSPAPHTISGTALIDTSYTAMTMLDSDPGRTLLVAFTDGVDTSSWLTADRVLQTARRSNAVTYGVSTSPLPRGSFLRELSDATGGSSIEIRSTQQLRAAFMHILEEFRQRYLVSYSPTKVPTEGWHP